ncbi:MAG: hypothetical protein H6Q18_953 [Bacteroidetes bacterium]|nr:hypothetical protein [Bacteroidota bacterium]
MNKTKLYLFVFLVFMVSVMLYSCGSASVPRPYGYFRVDLPPHSYERFDSAALPYTFEKSTLAQVTPRIEKGESFWLDLKYPRLNASIYCSYKPVRNDLFELSEETRKIVYKHTIKADAIGEKNFENPEKKVYGILYDLTGNTASSVQFVLTDSSRHFFRGALYFENVPNKDSIAPMSAYIREDVIHLMESFEWKK